jgi:hypothetical protein
MPYLNSQATENATMNELDRSLEQHIDEYGLATVLERIQYVCLEKAEHVQANWGDSVLAKQWESAANVVGTASTRQSILKVSP